MDANLSTRADLSYSDEPPLLLAASSDAAMARAAGVVAASGVRIGARLPIDQACERLARQARTGAVWIEVDEDGGGPMDDLLEAVSRDVRDERYVAVVSTTIEFLDAVAARINEPGVDILVNPTEAERIAALAAVTAASGHRSARTT